MKKTILILSVIFALAGLVSCGNKESNESYQQVYEKIQKGDELTVDDYDLMLDYTDDALSALSKAKNAEDMQKVEKKYKYANEFFQELKNGNPSDEVKQKLESKAKKIYKKYEKVSMQVEKRLSSGNSDEDDFDSSDDNSSDDF